MSSANQDLRCGVCQTPTTGTRCGVLACDACKKFFLRNRRRMSRLVCISGQENCLHANHRRVIATPPYTTTNNNNNNNRLLYCGYCRLKRCFEIGMRVLQDQITESSTANGNNIDAKKSQSFESNPTTPDNGQNNCSTVMLAFPKCNEMLMAETTLRIAMEALPKLNPIQQLPWASTQELVPSSNAMWQHAMVNFNIAVGAGVSFVKHLSTGGITTPLSPSDRCFLFAGSFIPNVVAQIAQTATTFLGMNGAMKAEFLEFFPIYKLIEADIDQIVALFMAWQPSHEELALLQALLFFRIDALAMLDNPNAVMEANRQLSVAITSLANQQDKNADLQMYFFRRAFDLLRDIERRYEHVVTQLAQDRPDLYHGNRLFKEMCFFSGADRVQRAAYLGIKFE